MTEFWMDSQGAGMLHVCSWAPEGEPKAVVQIVHGIAEYALRYDGFARYLAERGFLVVAEDHMGHGRSIDGGSIQGYFHGGWFAAVEDTYRLLRKTRQEYPSIPYVLLGHSMGSFMVRTLLCRYPDSGIAGAILSGSGWQPGVALAGGIQLAQAFCARVGQTNPSQTLDKLIFGGYNNRVEHRRTRFDWLSRDQKAVDAYVADPLCGFTASTGLLRDMLLGIRFVQNREHLKAMRPDLPVLFISGGDDPVGAYGKGVLRAVQAFREAGMKHVCYRIYPLCRHELLNEINKTDVYEDIQKWLEPVLMEE